MEQPFKDNFKFWVKNYDRETIIGAFIEVITQANPDFTYDWTGSLGFKPYTGMGVKKYYNFMY